MSEYYKSSSDTPSRRPKGNASRAVNNNNNIKGFVLRRRNRGSRMKFPDMTRMLVPGANIESPLQSPIFEDRERRAKPELQYSRDELIELMKHPLSNLKHPCLENAQNKNLLSGKKIIRWLEGRWVHRKHNDSLTDDDRSDGSLDPQKKRINEAKSDGLRKDQEVVLSPQRRSFNSGCSVTLPPQNLSNNRQPDSPHKADRDPSHREQPVRRIGSGRIMRDNTWDLRNPEKEEISTQSINNHDFNFRQKDERYERKAYDRPYEKERQQQRNSRYGNDRRRSDKIEHEEPEWFSGGPTSQHDTIELHGFDGPVVDKTTPPKKQNKGNKNSSKSNRKASEKSETLIGKKQSNRKYSSPGISSQLRICSPVAEDPVQEQPTQQHLQSPDNISTITQTIDANFDIDDYLNFDSIPSILSPPNGCVEDSGSGSRFSQFFRRDSPSPNTVGQTSTHDVIFNSRIKDISSTNVTIPTDGDNYFAPISPAGSSIMNNSFKEPSSGLLEMLQRGNQGHKITKKPSLRDLEASGKIHNVEELEARLRHEQSFNKSADSSNHSFDKEEELAAFRKLMINHQSHNMQDPKPNMVGGFQDQHGQLHQNQQMPIPHDLLMKLLQVQQQQRHQEAFAKLFQHPSCVNKPSQFSVPPPITTIPPEHYNNVQSNKDLLQRPEAQAIIRSLKRGEITILHLVDQLKRNTNMQPIQREILTSIIKFHSIQSEMLFPGMGIGQREHLTPSSEQLLHQIIQNPPPLQPQQQLRIPSPHVLQRVSSPRDLVNHTLTRNILQNTFMKNKLEEQKDSFRKRIDRSLSPNISSSHNSTTSPTPLTFTPTSVLRKMAAGKDSDMSVKQHLHQLDISQQSPKGRAIVKGNIFSVPPPALPLDYMAMSSQQKNEQQRNNMPQGGGNIQQQFIMNVNRNKIPPPPAALLTNTEYMGHGHMGYPGGASSPVSNQLARWFSPELLAQARAGKLPDMPPISPTQNMLSVEELERLQQAVHN